MVELRTEYLKSDSSDQYRYALHLKLEKLYKKKTQNMDINIHLSSVIRCLADPIDGVNTTAIWQFPARFDDPFIGKVI